MYHKVVSFLIVIVFYTNSFSQPITDTTNNITNQQVYSVGNGRTLIYTKGRNFDFITKLPKDAKGIVVAPFQKESLKPLMLVAASTGILLLADVPVRKGVTNFSRQIHLHSEEEYKDIFNIKMGSTDVSILKAPRNINTALYQVGQGFPSLLIGAGLFIYGKMNNDYRSVSTASQLAESFILMGVSTQVLKRISGRQTPGVIDINATSKWLLFPSFKNYQQHTPEYDAFPSGHLATLMSTVTVLAQNYPEKGWIKPIGYTITGMVGYAMINNDVHWISDYSLALALGYLCAKQVAKNSRREVRNTSANKFKPSFNYSINYSMGRFMPEVVCKF